MAFDMRAYQQRWRANNRKKWNAYGTKWRAANPERVAAFPSSKKGAEYQRRHRARLKEKGLKPRQYPDNGRAKRWRERHPEQVAESKRKTRTGWTHEAFEAAWVKQCGKCAICRVALKKSIKEDRRLYACSDHCHKTGKPRALLCPKCNWGLGNFGDDPDLLRAAARYLEEHRAASP